jgi:tetratricopeptide (TPR) repeat protein
VPPIWAGVPPMPPHFLGRDELIQSLLTGLTGSESLALSAEGLPGVGKTALAVALAHHRQVLGHFQDGVLWAGLGRQADVMSTLAEWALVLGQDVTHLPTVPERQKAVQRAIGQRRLLLVIDDAWELDAARAMRCGGPHCCHLLTTRDKGLARAFAGAAHTESVPTLADDPAFTLLQTLAPEACQADPEATRQLAQAVGGLPLALELLGGYLAAPERSVFADLSQAALAEVSDPRRRLQLAQERLGAPGKEVTLLDTITLSLEGLGESEAGQKAVAAFYALGAFAPKPEQFSREATEAVTGSDGATLALLIARNLVEQQQEQLTLHQTLADVARTEMPDTAVARHRAYYLDLANEDREDWRRIGAVYGQIKHAWQHTPLDEALAYVWALRIYQERQGLWSDQLQWTERGLASARAAESRKDEGTLLNNIGGIYDSLGQREKALDFYNRALPIWEEVGDRAGLAITLNNIGPVYDSLGQREKALDFYNRALPIWEEVGDRAGLAITLNNIGLVYDSLGQQEKALDFFNRALPIREEVGDRAGLATTLNNIGGVYNSLGQREKTLDFYNRALSITEEVGDRAGLATTLNNIGGVYKSLGQLEKALDFYHRALSITEEVGDRAGLATTLNNIGLVYKNLGQREKALDFYHHTLSITEEVGDRAGEIVTRYNLSMVYRAQGQLAESVAELKRVVELDRLMQHPELESDMAMLAQVEAELAAQRLA